MGMMAGKRAGMSGAFTSIHLFSVLLSYLIPILSFERESTKCQVLAAHGET
jgi:hypothetical protein